MNCEACGEYSGSYRLCKKCYYLSKDGKLIKCDKCGIWHNPNISCANPSTQSYNDKVPQTFVYNTKPSLLTETEKGFYRAIKEVLSDGYCLFPQINLAAVISKDDNSPFQNELFRNIDFLITDSEFKPLIFIEINDSSHNSSQRKERDLKVHNICEEAGIPIIIFWTSYGVNKEYIKKKIDTTLSELPVKRVAHSKPSKNQNPQTNSGSRYVAYSNNSRNQNPQTNSGSRYVAYSNNSRNQNPKTNLGGCYIATCIYGSYDCPQVWTLRRFRDFKLSKSFFGRLFIKTYYKISPKIVKLFGKQNWFRNFWKKRLDKMVDKLQNKGYDNTPYYDR